MNSFIKAMQELLRYKHIKIVVRDGTKIFVEPMDYKVTADGSGKKRFIISKGE